MFLKDPEFKNHQFIKEILKKHWIQEDRYFLSHTIAVDEYFHLKHHSSIIHITNTITDEIVEWDTFRIIFIKKDKINNMEYVEDKNWIKFQNPFLILYDYMNDRDKFMNQVQYNEYEVEQRLWEIINEDLKEMKEYMNKAYDNLKYWVDLQ